MTAFQVEVTLAEESVKLIERLIKAIEGVSLGQTPQESPQDKPQAPERKTKAKVDKRVEPKTKEPQTATEQPTVKFETIQALAVSKIRGGKRAEVKALLAAQGVEGFTDLKPENWPEVLEALEAL